MIKCSVIGCKKESVQSFTDKRTKIDTFSCKEHKIKTKGMDEIEMEKFIKFVLYRYDLDLDEGMSVILTIISDMGLEIK